MFLNIKKILIIFENDISTILSTFVIEKWLMFFRILYLTVLHLLDKILEDIYRYRE